MASALEAALDALYAEAPATFTKARDALAKSLAAKGDQAAAANTRTLKKPSVVAYALNQIARRFPDDVAELVDVGRALARAQRKALRGDAADDLREAITRQREALRGLVRKATALLRELSVPATHLGPVTAALQTALVDPAAGEALEAGRLDAVPEHASGFLGDIEGLPAPPKTRPPPEARTRTRTRAAAAKANAQAAAESAARAASARAAAQRDAAAKAARKEADARAAAAANAAAEAQKLEKAAKAATRHARELASVAKRAEAAAKRAESGARGAR